jgi:hypothetical protein
MIPFSQNPHFVGRNEILRQLEHRFETIGSAHTRIALFGLGGVGLYSFQATYEVLPLINPENHKLPYNWPIRFEKPVRISPYSGSMRATLTVSMKGFAT